MGDEKQVKQAWPESVPDRKVKSFESDSEASTESYLSKSDYLAIRKRSWCFYCIVVAAVFAALIVLACIFAIIALGTDVAILNTQVQQQQVDIDHLKGSVSTFLDKATAIKELDMAIASLNASIHHNPANLTLQNLTALEGRVSQLENQSREHVTNLVNSHRLWFNDTIETLYEYFEQLQTLVYGNTHEIRRVDNATQGHLYRLESTLRGSIEELESVSYRNISQVRAAMDTLAGSVDEVNTILNTLHNDVDTISRNLTQLRVTTLGEFLSVRENIDSRFRSIQEHFNSEVDGLRQELDYDGQLASIRNDITELKHQVNNNGASSIGGQSFPVVLAISVIIAKHFV